MIFSLNKLWNRLKFITIFIILTYVLYMLMQLVSSWIVPQYRYEEPSGRSIKAFSMMDTREDTLSFKDRLRLFYWYGE